MSDKLPPNLIDMRGKKSLTCPKCGFEEDLPPRTISSEELKRMADAEKDYSSNDELVTRVRNLKPGLLDVTIANSRKVICGTCGNVMIIFDEFSSLSEVVGPCWVVRPPKNSQNKHK